MATILVTGASGQVGSELKALSNHHPDWTFIFTDVEELDITNAEVVKNFFQENQPNFCLNCAAYTAVDKAESNKELAEQINKTGAVNLAQACHQTNAHFIQLSTDYVYHNEVNRPLIESDPTAPKGVYAATKLAGDLAVLAINPDFTVIRTSWVYSSFGHNFVKTMVRLGTERDQLRVVFDQVGTPTYAADLAKAMLHITAGLLSNKLDRKNAGGVFHYSNEGGTSWYDFALAIFDLEDISCSVDPIESIEYPTPAQRPHYSVLNKAKIKKTFDLQVPHWKNALSRCLKKLKEKAV